MVRPRSKEPDDTHGDEVLTITSEQFCFIIVKASELDVKEAIPTLGDDLEEGLSMFGRSCEDVEMGRL